MPNLCDFNFKVIDSKRHIKKFLTLNDYDVKNHFYRLFEFEGDMSHMEKVGFNKYAVEGFGECAWSVYSCCIEGYSKIDLLAYWSKKLKLKIEIFSTEPGMGFLEHYIYDNGDQLLDETGEYYEYYYDEDEHGSFEEYKKEYSIPEEVTKDDFVDGYYEYSEFDIHSFTI